MAQLVIRWGDIDGLNRFDNMLKALGDQQGKAAMRNALNRAGDMAKTQVIRSLTKQTGLKRKTIVRAIGTPKRASWSDMRYEMKTRGGNISLAHFNPKETKRGVTASPFGKRTLFPGTFMKAGWWPGRVVKPGWNGQLFLRDGLTSGGTDKFTKQKSGVFIPTEMVRGATAEAFETAVRDNLPRRVEHEFARLSKGALT